MKNVSAPAAWKGLVKSTRSTFGAIHRKTYCFAVSAIWLMAQASEKLPKEIQPDEKSTMKLRALLALLGLIILFVGVSLMIWLFGRSMRRWTSGESKPIKGSRFSEFGYHLGEQIKRDKRKIESTGDEPENSP